MNVGATFVANGEATKAMQPRERAFDDPAQDTQTAAIRRAALGKHGNDALCMQPVAMRLGVLAAIALEHIVTTSPAAAAPADRRQLALSPAATQRLRRRSPRPD